MGKSCRLLLALVLLLLAAPAKSSNRSEISSLIGQPAVA
jgi:hypothetical protein